MFQYHCLNPIASVGLDGFGENYRQTDDFNEADAVLSITFRLTAVRIRELLFLIHPEQIPTVSRSWFWQECFLPPEILSEASSG